MSVLREKRIVLGVCGSIAAFKAVALASQLTQAGAAVTTILTRDAARFVTPLSFASVTQRPAHLDLFTPDPGRILHIALAEEADLLAVVPATAHTLARMAQGLSDDLLTCTFLSTQAPVLVAPAMDGGMFTHAATQASLATLHARGVRVVEPLEGRAASGLVAKGRMPEVDALMAEMRSLLGKSGPLAGKTVVVTAGGTQEPLDPVRYIGNRSSGKMGFALAEAARDCGARVILIQGATTEPPPAGIAAVSATTAADMLAAVREHTVQADALIMAAAVADYRPETSGSRKTKRTGEPLSLTLIENEDILRQVPTTLVKVGFAAETEGLLQNAEIKLARKNADMIVGNDISQPDSGFGTDTNKVVILSQGSPPEPLPLLPKSEVAAVVLERVAALVRQRCTSR
ncbi:MAG: bifunctional phosphopantothenoylcysteine decarboxylase/phosphopantothenate--cysteine ligase CoaBC [Chloroflexi bacterium]|nr:bifunctional phosphopantothenoylcysteine decarboxylase/phosphopantothenate--cysteine ligase CoaBC [Chloroflexota bacterium]